MDEEGIKKLQKPSIGRIVHYQAYGTPGGEYASEPRAAIITDVNTNPDTDPYVVSLAVINPTGLFFARIVEHDAGGKPGTWRWPPRV